MTASVRIFHYQSIKWTPKAHFTALLVQVRVNFLLSAMFLFHTCVRLAIIEGNQIMSLQYYVVQLSYISA